MVNQEMDLQGECQLFPKLVVHDPIRRKHYKNILVSIMGKFCQRNTYNNVELVSTHQQLIDICKNQDLTVEQIFCLNENICQVTTSPKLNKVKPCLTTNSVIGAYVIAYGRLHIYQDMMKIIDIGGKVYGINTDAIAYSLPKEIQSPLVYSNCFGHYKPEMGKNSTIVSFHSLGPNYISIKYVNSEGETRTSLKASGLSLSPEALRDTITDDKMAEFVDAFLDKVSLNMKIDQHRIKHKLMELKSFMRCNVFSNDMYKKRIVHEISENECTVHITYPYGYNMK